MKNEFAFECSIPIEECISQLEDITLSVNNGRKGAQLVIEPIAENVYQFSFEKLKNRTVVSFSGKIISQSHDLISITGHASVGRATWIWLVYFVLIAVVFVQVVPLLSLIATGLAAGYIAFAIRDCRNSPQMLYELLNCDQKSKSKQKRK